MFRAGYPNFDEASLAVENHPCHRPEGWSNVPIPRKNL